VIDLLLLATMLLVCGGIGLPLARLLPERFVWRLLVAPTLGIAVLGVAVPIAYRAGASILYMFWAFIALSAISFALQGRATIRMAREVGWYVAAVLVATAVLLLAPRWFGGDRFAVFQGNQWDLFGYLESAVVYARKRHAVVAHVSDYATMRNPMVALASAQLSSRPSAHQLYALFSRVAPGQAYHLHYAFIAGCFALAAQSITFVVRNSFTRLHRSAWLLLPLAFPLGFWGQYVLDINAWSQAVAQPALFLMFGLTVHALARPEIELRTAGRIAAVIATTVAGAIFIYPEGFLIFAAALGPLSLVVIIVRIVRARVLRISPIVPLFGYVGVATIVLYPPQLAFLLAQLRWSSATIVPWWQFFQGFFYGRDGLASHGFARFADYTAGFFGLYFATPAKGAGLLIALVRRVAILGTIAGVLAALVGVRRDESDDRTRMHVTLWSIAVLLMLLPALKLTLAGNYWPAGKIVAFTSPIFMTLLCVPVGISATGWRRTTRIIVGVFLAFQIVTGFTRIIASGHRYGVHYAPPYPAVNTNAVKKDLVWDLRPLEALPRSTKVLIRPMNPWETAYLAVFLYSRRIPFAYDGKVNTYFGDGVDLPGLPPPWKPDAEISLEPKMLVVRFNDGRAPLRLAAGRNLR
jgi:hypothetical protein